MPFTIEQINQFVPKKGRYENINRDDPAQNNVLANMRLLYDELEEPSKGGTAIGFSDLRKALKEAMDAADGLLPPEVGNAALLRIEAPWSAFVSSCLDPNVSKDPEMYVKGEENRARLRNLIGHVNAGLGNDPVSHKPTQEQKEAAAKRREADKEAAGENADIQAKEALERLKAQAANGGKKAEETADQAPLNGRTVLDDLIAQGKRLPKHPQNMGQLSQLAEQARDLCLDIMATRRTIGALRNQPKLLDKDFSAADRDKWKEELKKSTALMRFLQNLPYDELRRLTSDGHGGALEDKFKEYTVRNLAHINDKDFIFADQHLPEEYRPTARQHTEAIQTKLRNLNTVFPNPRRNAYIELMATRAAVDSVRGDKKSLDVKVDPKRLREEMQKFLKEPLQTALHRAIVRNYANDVPAAAQEGHGGALEDIVREEVRKMSAENKGGAMVNADKRYAPTYVQRMADIERMLKSNKLTDDQKLERTVEAMLLSQREDFGEKGARIGDINALNKEVADTVKLFKSVANNKFEYGKMIESIKSPNLPLESKMQGVENFRKNHRGQIMAIEKEAEIKESLAGRVTRIELEDKAAQKLAIQTSMFRYNQSAQEELTREYPNMTALSIYQRELVKDLDENLRANASKIEEDEAFKLMCSKMDKKELAEALGKDGFELMDKYAAAKRTLEAREKEGRQPIKDAQEKQEEKEVGGGKNQQQII